MTIAPYRTDFDFSAAVLQTYETVVSSLPFEEDGIVISRNSKKNFEPTHLH